MTNPQQAISRLREFAEGIPEFWPSYTKPEADELAEDLALLITDHERLAAPVKVLGKADSPLSLPRRRLIVAIFMPPNPPTQRSNPLAAELPKLTKARDLLADLTKGPGFYRRATLEEAQVLGRGWVQTREIRKGRAWFSITDKGRAALSRLNAPTQPNEASNDQP
jgi:hypothetical protein